MPESKDKGLRKGHVAVRLDSATIARLDALLALYALPGRAATRSDGLRAVILAGLVVEERRAVLAAEPAVVPSRPPPSSLAGTGEEPVLTAAACSPDARAPPGEPAP
jgi:hypothetical protein